MTREVIEKLPPNVREKIEAFRRERKGFEGDYLRQDLIRERAGGYTQGLCDGGLLTDRERQIVFIYTTV